ncbi:sensor histidine kinase [Fusobacterium sp.]|uniref:sensor histidine kinase n=1 Tax=Fusobacterium sp. TaxID=68766 RepID=UPI00260C236F|nr:sensor histidine kinase [Fusobacterium sp.]
MKVSRSSLLFRMVFYNDIAIVMVSITIALFLTFTAFQNIESKFIDSARDKVALITRAYSGEILKSKDDLNQVIRNVGALGDRNFRKNFTYTQQAKMLQARLLKKNFSMYKDSNLSIVDEDGIVLAESNENHKKTIIDQVGFKENVAQNDGEIKTTYFFKNGDNIYSRTILRYEVERSRKLYVVLTMPTNQDVLNALEAVGGLGEEDSIILLIDGKYISNGLNFTDEMRAIKKRDPSRNFIQRFSYIYKKKDSNKEVYYIALTDLYDYKNEYIGSMGVAIYYEAIEKLKRVVSLSVIMIILLFVAVSTTVSAKLFGNLLDPLSKIIDAAEEVSKGNYKIFVKPEGVDEIRTLSKSFNKMAEDIRNNEEQAKNKNKKLLGTLKRLDSIERILMNIQIENDMTVTVKEIMSAFTSEVGLGYSRAMYFRYSREADRLVGELAVINNRVKREMLNNEGNTSGFKFQIAELNELVKLIKIPFKSDSLIVKSLVEKRIIFENDKGYKYNLGNELFKSFGINRFLIMPIYSEKRNYGCIVVDYFGKDNNISQEEVELLTLLSLNIAIRIKNRTIEEEKIDLERAVTTGKLVERFFKSRENSFEKMLDFMEKMTEYDQSNILLKIQIQEIKNEIIKLKREKEILNEYINVKSDEPLEIIDIEEIISEVISGVEEKLEKIGINISTFINYNGKIIGNRARLKRALYEVIKNAKESFDKKNQDNKKINIIVTKEKNVDKIRINIIDNGIGMTKEQLENIFEPFVGYNENSPGLGLAIVSRIVKDHHGVIKILSQENEGTDVKITLNIYKEEIL